MSSINPKHISESPQMWLIQVPAEGFDHRPPPDCDDFFIKLDPSLIVGQFRGVNISRLPTILRSGIDVEPPDSVFYADSFEKAWEYGEWPKVLFALDVQKLRRTFTEVPSNTPPAELARLRKTFPTMLRSRDGSTLWLSRLREDDPKLGSAYEMAYAWWIEGNPFEALRGLFIFWRPQDAKALEQIAN
jgi:hypothetical protein